MPMLARAPSAPTGSRYRSARAAPCACSGKANPLRHPKGSGSTGSTPRDCCIGGALSEGGNLWEWISENFHLSPRDTLGARVAAIPPDSHGLTWLPFLAGERSVGWSPDARGVIAGLTLRTTPEEILRAGLEAISYRFGLIAELIQPYVANDRAIIGSGNALVNDRNWAQMISDVTGWDLIESEEPEASLRGAALVGLESLGEIDRLESAAGNVLQDARRFTPDKERHEIYLKGMHSPAGAVYAVVGVGGHPHPRPFSRQAGEGWIFLGSFSR